MNADFIILPEYNVIITNQQPYNYYLDSDLNKQNVAIGAEYGIHAQIVAGLQGLPTINYNGLEEKLRVVDVDKLADLFWKEKHRLRGWKNFTNGFIKGFEIAKKLYLMPARRIPIEIDSEWVDIYNGGIYKKEEPKIINNSIKIIKII